MADDAVNALIPVAAVVHIALGVMALMLVRRTVDREWNEIYAGYVISWMMIVLGLQYTFATLLDLKIDNFKTTNVNILLNRVRLDKKRTFKKRIIFSFSLVVAITSVIVYFII